MCLVAFMVLRANVFSPSWTSLMFDVRPTLGEVQPSSVLEQVEILSHSFAASYFSSFIHLFIYLLNNTNWRRKRIAESLENWLRTERRAGSIPEYRRKLPQLTQVAGMGTWLPRSRLCARFWPRSWSRGYFHLLYRYDDASLYCVHNSSSAPTGYNQAG